MLHCFGTRYTSPAKLPPKGVEKNFLRRAAVEFSAFIISYQTGFCKNPALKYAKDIKCTKKERSRWPSASFPDKSSVDMLRVSKYQLFFSQRFCFIIPSDNIYYTHFCQERYGPKRILFFSRHFFCTIFLYLAMASAFLLTPSFS